VLPDLVSLRLLLASIWLPNYVIKSELERVATTTTDALQSLLEEVAPSQHQIISKQIKPLSGSIEKYRAVMAANHSLLLKVLSDEIGHDRAVEMGRDALFKVGITIGEESGKRLGVGDNIEDLFMAARLMYSILGIEFSIKEEGGHHYMEFHRCALSVHYSELTCTVMSAIDEGVIRGLNPRASMSFKRRITSGYSTCLACIKITS
jgi:hypothetical protein